MNGGPVKRKLNPESVSPEAHQAKVVFPKNRTDTFIQSLPGGKCPHCKKECTSENKALQCDLCGICAHAEYEGISSDLYNNFNSVVCSLNNLS